MTLKTKYNIGDTVWLLHGYKAREAKITGVDVQALGVAKPSVKYRFYLYPPVDEEYVYKSKEELIKKILK